MVKIKANNSEKLNKKKIKTNCKYLNDKKFIK